VNTNKF
jgi:dynein heavy chain